MSKGTGRRRISPTDGISYDEDEDMTNIEKRGGGHTLSHNRERILGIRAWGAPPTAEYDYGSHDGSGTNGRYSGRGRKNDHRNWKNYTKGKQYKNLVQ